MSHTALARKYRPRRFHEVSTQGHVSETLRRAVASDRVGHAYLFAGPRGIGKTTLARVLAMALNCPDRSAEGEPCGTCSSCQGIWGGRTSLDVVEIDAASNRGVDDARDLRERAMYAPSGSDRFKVYIVDEAHMLTREAWNALLKILEEPPARVIFVFATTEPQKIEQTAAPILSRCQRFDFRRVGVSDIVARLREVLEAEGVEGPEEALRLIARKANGGMRDALSLTDQVLALSEDGLLTPEVARRVLGVVEDDRYRALLEILAGKRPGRVFPYVDELVEEGYDLVEFHHGLLDALRILLRLRLEEDEIPELSPESRDAWRERAEDFSAADLVRMLGIAGELAGAAGLRRSAQPRILLELLLLRLAYLDRTVEIEELMEALGGGRAEGAPAPSPPSGGDAGAGAGTANPRVPDGPGRAPRAHGESRRPGEEVSGPARAPEGVSRPAQGDSPDTRLAAWERVVEGGGDLPRGLQPFLRAASVEVDGRGTFRVALPPGPGLEMLSEPVAEASLRRALARELGASAEVEVRETGEVGSDRVTPESVRRDELRDLLSREPGLREAVEELDLELRD